MADRQRRDWIYDQRPPSRQRRRLLREARFEVARLLRSFAGRSSIHAFEAAQVRKALALCRRATARDPHPDWLGRLPVSSLPDHPEAVAALRHMQPLLAAIELTWERRLVAAGIDPKWPEDEA